MKSTSTLMVVVVMVAVVVGMMTPAVAVSCSTGGGCPTQADANTCVQFVRNKGSTTCCQQGSNGACTNMCAAGSAAVDICGPKACTTCTNAGDALNSILATCVQNVGGVSRVCGTTSAYGFTFQIRHS